MLSGLVWVGLVWFIDGWFHVRSIWLFYLGVLDVPFCLVSLLMLLHVLYFPFVFVCHLISFWFM